MSDMNRRNLIKSAMIGAGVLMASSSPVKAAMKSCGLTPAQTEGPFYPIADQLDKDNDLTFVKNRNQRALGEVIIISGVVKNDQCQPVAGVLVEIWQACASGKYNHPGDPNPAKLDPNFQYWGRAITNNKGEYIFKTIKPGHYQATDTWMRPAHIHFKVHRRGFQELTSQLYFSDDKYNANDRILQSLSREDQNRVIVDLKPGTQNYGLLKPRVGNFDITILGA